MKPARQTKWFAKFENNKLVIAGLAFCLCLLVGATAYRTHAQYSVPSNSFDWSDRGHADFHCGTYYPTLGYRNGLSPYSKQLMEEYPVSSPARASPPISFLIHLPFTYLDLHAADVAFFIYNTALLLVLAFFTVQVTRGSPSSFWWLVVSCALMISRPGHITLFTGYFTAELVLGTVFAFHFAKTRPLVSGLGMLIASGKTTYVLPLIVLMLARKNYRATLYGLLFCLISGIGGLAWLAKDVGITEILNGIQEAQAVFYSEETEYPINTWTRVDLVGMFARTINWIPRDSVYLAGMFLMLAIPSFAIWKTADHESDSGITGATALIALLAMLTSVYHHSYDCMLIFIPWVGLVFFGERMLPGFGARSKLWLKLLLSVPVFNYLSTLTVRNLVGWEQTSVGWHIATLLSGGCLLVALTIVVLTVLKRPETLERPERSPDSPNS